LGSFLLIHAIKILLWPICHWLMWREDFDGCRSNWEYFEALKTREPMSGPEFYRRYYKDSGIPEGLVVCFLDFHATFWDKDPELTRPEDDLFRVYGGFDMAPPWMKAVEKEFAIKITPKDIESLKNGSFDELVKLVFQKWTEQAEQMSR